MRREIIRQPTHQHRAYAIDAGRDEKRAGVLDPEAVAREEHYVPDHR